MHLIEGKLVGSHLMRNLAANDHIDRKVKVLENQLTTPALELNASILTFFLEITLYIEVKFYAELPWKRGKLFYKKWSLSHNQDGHDALL